jgi:putative FmdB family regulatory protein
MPLYLYQCKACQEETEEIQKMGEKPPSTCPHCEKEGTLEKKIAVSNFQLKGSGWAKDGY